VSYSVQKTKNYLEYELLQLNLKQKHQKVNLQMSCQQNTDNSRYKMRNMLPTKDIMNITQTRIERNVESPLWCRVNSCENSITVINMRHYQWHNQLLLDSKRSLPCMWLNRSQNRVNSLTNRLLMIQGRQVPVQNKSQISYHWHHLYRIRTKKQLRLRHITTTPLDKYHLALLGVQF
jgi:hypothetical protein